VRELISSILLSLDPKVIPQACDKIIETALKIRGQYLPRLKIVRDDRLPEPRLGTFASWHPGLGHVRPGPSPEEWVKDYEYHLPVYVFDHGTLTISIIPFTFDWESGFAGYMATDERRAANWYGDVPYDREEVLRTLAEEVAEYDYYLRGSAWGYVYKDEVMWGFTGDTLTQTGLMGELVTLGLGVEEIERAWEERDQ